MIIFFVIHQNFSTSSQIFCSCGHQHLTEARHVLASKYWKIQSSGIPKHEANTDLFPPRQRRIYHLYKHRTSFIRLQQRKWSLLGCNSHFHMVSLDGVHYDPTGQTPVWAGEWRDVAELWTFIWEVWADWRRYFALFYLWPKKDYFISR